MIVTAPMYLISVQTRIAVILIFLHPILLKRSKLPK